MPLVATWVKLARLYEGRALPALTPLRDEIRHLTGNAHLTRRNIRAILPLYVLSAHYLPRANASNYV